MSNVNRNLGAQWWHGTPYGGPSDTPGEYGVHVGTQEAARQALNASIGHRADGKDWDGTSEYGKTLLAGKQTLERLGRYPTGYSAIHAPAEDHYPSGEIGYSKHPRQIPLDTKPALFPVRIVGEMTDGVKSDAWANGTMRSRIRNGTARRGYFYENIGEDAGSISAVVPSWQHLERAD